MSDVDDDGYVIPGTYAISAVRLGGAMADGTPVPFIESAVCAVCGGWASHVFTAGQSTKTDHSDTGIIRSRISRVVMVTTYSCPDHCDAVSEGLVDEFGFSTNWYEPNSLAEEVNRTQRLSMRSDPE